MCRLIGLPFAVTFCTIEIVILSALAGYEKAKDETPKKPGREIVNSIKMKLVAIPAGSFTMGSPKDEEDRGEDEGPEHEVKISKPFFMGVHEVTQGQFKAVMGNNPSWFSAGGKGKDKVKNQETADFPVDSVSWEDALKFCTKLSELPAEKKAGRTYRLPTEAEWEYACRAGKEAPFHYGPTLSSTQANFNGNNPYVKGKKGPYLERTTKVGSFKPNAWGLYDMHGNVYEWTADWYNKDYYRDSLKVDPKGPAEKGSIHVRRGGSWRSDAEDCRCAFRKGNYPDDLGHDSGFRVVCNASSKASGDH
jgi:formylglycine-generating enzyme required for sulfatase activity